MNKKTCAFCHMMKSTAEFNKRGSRFHSYCKVCRKLKLDIDKERIRKHSWYLQNRNISIERASKRASEKPDDVKGYKQRHYDNNKELIKAKASALYYANKDNLDFKVKRNNQISKWRNKNKHIIAWRSLLRTVLKKLGQCKTNLTIVMLGYSANELKEYLEGLWLPQMNWDNYGEWHIDHVKPIYTFNKLTDVKIVNALSNLRPLWATTRTINGVLYEGNLNRSRKNVYEF